MILTVTILLLLSAFLVTIVHAMGHAPVWPAVLLVIIDLLLQVLPR